MADLIDRDAVLSEITRCKDYAHKTFARSSADKKQKNFYEHTAYCEGVFDAWEDAETLISRTPAVNRWIPVEDALPEENVRCLVYTEGGGYGISRRMDRNLEKWNCFGLQVTHWMPLPEPPEKE